MWTVIYAWECELRNQVDLSLFIIMVLLMDLFVYVIYTQICQYSLLLHDTCTNFRQWVH